MLQQGQYNNPVRIIGVNLNSGIACDASETLATEAMRSGRIAPESRDFVIFHLGLMNAPP